MPSLNFISPKRFFFSLLFPCAFRYMTAFTDSDEEESSDTELGQEEQLTNKLGVLLENIDRLHQGTESDKRESLDVLLQHRDEVSCFTLHLSLFFGTEVHNYVVQFRYDFDWLFQFTVAVWTELRLSLAADPSLLWHPRRERHNGGAEGPCRNW